MNYKLTIDKGLMNQPTDAAEAIEILKRWKTEGKVELDEAEPSVARGNVTPETKAWFAVNKADEPKTARPKEWRRRPSKVAAGKLNFAQVAAILFPSRDAHRLNMTEINDVAHLIKHHNSGNELFVTGNTQNFIAGGRRERLKALFGVITMTPQEAVQMLTELEGWK